MIRADQQLSVVERVRALLALRDWWISDLAERIGVRRERTVLNLLCGNNRSDRTRYRCECALGSVSIWHTAEELKVRSLTNAWFDKDVYLMPRQRLEVFARRHLRANGVGQRVRSAKQILRHLEAIATGGTKQFPQEVVRGRTAVHFGVDVYRLKRDALDRFARPHLRAAGLSGRIRPMSLLLRTLEDIAAKSLSDAQEGANS